MKCNIDAAFFQDVQCFGYGMCICNHHGQFVKAHCGWRHGYPLVHEGEAWALLLITLQWLLTNGFEKVIIEFDCKLVLDALHPSKTNHSEFGFIIKKCKNILSFFSYLFVRRQANSVAHALARASKFYATSYVFNSVLDCISSLVINEMN